MRGIVLANRAHALAGRIRPLPRPPRLELALRGQRSLVSDGETVRRGQPLTDPPETSVPVLAPLAGRVTLGNDRLIITTAAEQPPPRATRPAGPRELVARLRECGVVGLGGAAFPLHRKIAAVAGRPLRLLIVNAVECDPHLASDAALLQSTPEELGAAIATLASMLAPERLVVAVEPVHEAIARRRLARAGAEIDVVPGRYPAGAETLLMARHLDTPLDPGERPTGRGALCVNIATAHAAYLAIRYGLPCTARLVTITGCGARDGVYRAAFGTPLGALVPDTERALIGGSMMGRRPPSDEPAVVDAACNGIHVGDLRRPASPCIRCAACIEVCPADLSPERLLHHIEAKDLETACCAGLDACLRCRACDVVCPSGIELAATFGSAQGEVARRRRAAGRAARAEQRWQRRQRRLAAADADIEDRQARRRRLAARRRRS